MLNKKINIITLKIFPFLISLTLFFPLLKENISSFTIILLGINLLLYKVNLRAFELFNFKFILLTIPFWVILCNAVYSTNLEKSLLHVRHSLFFLIIPLIFSFIPNEFFTLKKINLYISVLKNICLLIVFIYIISFLNTIVLWKVKIGYYEFSDFREFVYNEFKVFKIHPTYFTSILILCTAHSYDLFLKERKYLQFIYIFTFLIITFLLMARLNTLILVCLLFYMTVFRSLFKMKYKVGLCLSIIFVVGFVAIKIPDLGERFKETLKSFDVKPKNLAYDSTNVRKAILDCDIILIKNNWIEGVGYENLQNSLNECFASNYNSSFYVKHDYMTHNYYFYILISSGIFGFVFYLFYLYNLLKSCINKNIFLLNVLLINTLIICFIEDYFYRQHGVLYFNLLLMIFIRFKNNDQQELLPNLE